MYYLSIDVHHNIPTYRTHLPTYCFHCRPPSLVETTCLSFATDLPSLPNFLSFVPTSTSFGTYIFTYQPLNILRSNILTLMRNKILNMKWNSTCGWKWHKVELVEWIKVMNWLFWSWCNVLLDKMDKRTNLTFMKSSTKMSGNMGEIEYMKN